MSGEKDSDVKPRGYKVQIDAGQVTVEHRAAMSSWTIVCIVVVYLCYCLIPPVRKILVNFYMSLDPVIGCFALLMLLIPIIFGATWFFFVSGEVMRCDTKELQLARRRTWGRWQRHCFSSADVRGLHRAIRGNAKTRNFTVLIFQYGKQTVDMLGNLNWTDSDRVLKACRSMGLDTVIVVEDAAMQNDIAQRGWFINPLKPD
jgi:hypothetical protein